MAVEEKESKELLYQLSKLNDNLEDFPNKRDFVPTRIDLKTRICVMASVIFGTLGDLTPKEAVEKAVEIENIAEVRVKKLKDENPINPGRGRHNKRWE